MIKRNEMHAELLRLLVENPATEDSKLSIVCRKYNEQAKEKDHMSWARRWLCRCIVIYESKMREPPSPMDAASAVSWAIAKNPGLSDKELVNWVLPRLKRKVKENTITKDYGPQMRDRLTLVATLSAQKRSAILDALGR